MPWNPSHPAMMSQAISVASPSCAKRSRGVSVAMSCNVTPLASNRIFPSASIRARIRSLTTSCWPYTTMERPVSAGEVDAVTAAAEAQLDAMMREAFALKAFADAGFDQQIDGALLQYAGAHAVLDVFAVATLEHDRVDARKMQQMRQQQAGRPRADNAYLRACVQIRYAGIAAAMTRPFTRSLVHHPTPRSSSHVRRGTGGSGPDRAAARTPAGRAPAGPSPAPARGWRT